MGPLLCVRRSDLLRPDDMFDNEVSVFKTVQSVFEIIVCLYGLFEQLPGQDQQLYIYGYTVF